MKSVLRYCTSAVLAALLGAAALPAAAQSAPGVSAGEIVIGQSASFSGSFASEAASYREGALAYLAAVNARGGVHGRQVRLVSLDDGYVVERALDNTRQLIHERQAFALFGYMWTNTVQASVPLAEAAGVPVIAPYTGYEALYARHSPHVFTTRASFADELNRIVQHLHTIGFTRIGLVHYDSASGRELLADTQQRRVSLEQNDRVSRVGDVNLRDLSGKLRPAGQLTHEAASESRARLVHRLVLFALGRQPVDDREIQV